MDTGSTPVYSILGMLENIVISAFPILFTTILGTENAIGAGYWIKKKRCLRRKKRKQEKNKSYESQEQDTELVEAGLVVD